VVKKGGRCEACIDPFRGCLIRLLSCVEMADEWVRGLLSPSFSIASVTAPGPPPARGHSGLRHPPAVRPTLPPSCPPVHFPTSVHKPTSEWALWRVSAASATTPGPGPHRPAVLSTSIARSKTNSPHRSLPGLHLDPFLVEASVLFIGSAGVHYRKTHQHVWFLARPSLL
jgi:hypothetical protein